MAWNFQPQQPQPGYPVVCPPGGPSLYEGGFENGTVYKIESIADMTILDIAGSATKKGSKVITFMDIDGKNQKFRAEKMGVGFRLIPCAQGKKGKIVLDLDQKAGKLGIWELNNGINQLFVAHETSPGSQIYLIKCLDNNVCLRNNGSKEQVTLVPENPADILQHWRLILTTDDSY